MKNLNKDNYSIFRYVTIIYLASVIFVNLADIKVDYFVYQILRIVVFMFSCWSVFEINCQEKLNSWIIPFVIVGILFNPIAPIALDKEVWFWVDVVVLVYLVVFQLKWQKMDCHGDKSPRNDE